MSDKENSAIASEELSREIAAIMKAETDQVISALFKVDEEFPRWKDDALTAVGFRSYLESHIDKKAARSLSRLILTLCRISAEERLEKNRFRELVGKLLSTSASRHDIEIKEELIEELATAINNAVYSESVEIVYRASKLYFDLDNRIDESNVIVEARPVFDREGAQVVGYIVKSVLTISDEHGERSNFNLSKKELDLLAEQADRAKKKMETLQKELSDKYPNRVISFGQTL